MENLLTVELLSIQIHKSVTSIRSDSTRNPRSLPPICRLPGTKRLLWRESDVDLWVAQHVTSTVDCPIDSKVADTAEVKRGRPTKRQQFASQRLQNRTANKSRPSKVD